MQISSKRLGQCQLKFKGICKVAPTLLLCASCTDQTILSEILYDALPEGANAVISEACTPLLQGAVALLDEVSLPDETPLDASNATGEWVRSVSLTNFSEADSATYRGVGVSATILDGKNCLRHLSLDADQILFGERSGWYYRSDNREIVVVLFDEPLGKGVMFVQAP